MSVPLERTAADGEEDPFDDPLIRALREIIPYHPMWADADKVRQFQDSLRERMSGKSKDTTPQEDAALKQTSPDHEYLNGEEGAEKWRKTRMF